MAKLVPPIAGAVFVALVDEATFDVVVLATDALEEAETTEADVVTDALETEKGEEEVVGTARDEEVDVVAMGEPNDTLIEASDPAETPFWDMREFSSAAKSLGANVCFELNPETVPVGSNPGSPKRSASGFEVVRGVPGIWNADD